MSSDHGMKATKTLTTTESSSKSRSRNRRGSVRSLNLIAWGTPSAGSNRGEAQCSDGNSLGPARIPGPVLF